MVPLVGVLGRLQGTLVSKAPNRGSGHNFQGPAARTTCRACMHLGEGSLRLKKKTLVNYDFGFLSGLHKYT